MFNPLILFAMDYITILDLYAYAKRHGLLEARVRITDAEAVSYYPNIRSVERGVYEIVIDVSNLEPIDFEELDVFARRMYGTASL